MKNTEEQSILLIEDNPGDIRLIKEMLTEITSFNYKLIVAETLKDGCEQIKNNNFVLILLDLNLPDSIGKQTFDTIIKFSETIPVVSVSGLKDVELSLSLIQEGAQDYIEKKDLNSSLLAKTIQYALIRKQAEVALKESEEKFRSYIENAPDGVFVVDETGHYLEINKAARQITGYSEEEILSMGIMDITPQESLEIAGNNFVTLVSTGFSSSEFYYKHKNGTNRMWSIDAVKISDTRFLGFARDITERKQSEKELIIAKDRAEESDRLKSAFLANMSHEIRTPMNGILGFSELLKEPKLTGEKQQEYIRIIEKSGARMLNIINDIVDISKIEANLMKVDIKDVNINEKLEFIFIFFKPQVEEKGMHLLCKNTLPTKEATIKTDNEKVYSILTNLVKNAIKYSKEGAIEFGYILKTASDPVELEFYVKDTGIGIPKDRQSAIFERFIQADITDKMARQGAGLGLSISKAYVEMLGGKIWVESEEGIGSTFYFTLPYNAEPEEKKVVEKFILAQEEKNNIKKLKILIAEDDEISGMLITIDVEKFSKEILKAENGFEAIEVCRNNPDIDLILMDIQLPVMNGHEATRQIRQFNKDVVIIAQTAFGLFGDREKAIEAGCNDYIAKPINKDKLIALIQKYFGK
jgi:PAS domain S-box-containing protein